VLGIAPTQVQDPALGLVELNEVHTCPRLKPDKVPLDLATFWIYCNKDCYLGDSKPIATLKAV